MKVLKLLDDHLEEVIIVVALALMFIFVFLQIFMRYVLNNALSWSEELARYLFVLFVNVGISFGVKTKRHIRVEVLPSLVSPKKQLVIQIFADIVFLFFAIVIVYYGFITTQRLFMFNQESPALRLPMALIYGTLPVSYVLVTIRLIQTIIAPFKTLKNGGKI